MGSKELAEISAVDTADKKKSKIKKFILEPKTKSALKKSGAISISNLASK